MHRFSEAEAIARRLVAMREFVLDFGLLGDALMEQGRVTEAAEAYQKMIDLKPFYQSYTRAAHLRWLRGDLGGAIEMMQAAVKAASPRDPESIAWAYSRLAMYELQRGRLADAGRMADASLRSVPDYAAALLARGRIQLAQKKPVDAVETLTHAARLNPLPEYQWALADALRLVSRTDEAAALEQPAGARRRPRRSAHARALPLHAATGRRHGRWISRDVNWRSARTSSRSMRWRGHWPRVASCRRHRRSWHEPSPKAPRTGACSSMRP